MSEVNQLKQDEGFRAKMYKCSEDKWTIGYGLNLESGITEEEAEAILTMRTDKVFSEIRRRLPWVSLAPVEIRDVLTNMGYQLGVNGLMNFKNMLGNMESGQYGLASMEMIYSRWAKQTPERAKRLADRVQRLQSPHPGN